jgi:1,4-alpha-glucan branching enzyme
MSKVITHSFFTDFDIDLFKAGKHYRLYDKLGAHLLELDGVKAFILLFGLQLPTLCLS